RDQLWQVAALLLLAAVTADLIDAEIRMRPVGQADRRRGAGNFLNGNHVLEIAEADAAIFLLDGDAVQTELSHPGPEVPREFIGAVDLRRTRSDMVLREVPHGFADRIGGLAEIEIENLGRVRDHCVSLLALRAG